MFPVMTDAHVCNQERPKGIQKYQKLLQADEKIVRHGLCCLGLSQG
jgi:hypothetical protein